MDIDIIRFLCYAIVFVIGCIVGYCFNSSSDDKDDDNNFGGGACA